MIVRPSDLTAVASMKPDSTQNSNTESEGAMDLVSAEETTVSVNERLIIQLDVLKAESGLRVMNHLVPVRSKPIINDARYFSNQVQDQITEYDDNKSSISQASDESAESLEFMREYDVQNMVLDAS